MLNGYKPENTKLAICNQEVNENSALSDILLAPVFNQGVFNCYKHARNCQFRISILAFSLKSRQVIKLQLSCYFI